MSPAERKWLSGLLRPLRHPSADDDDEQERRKLHFDVVPAKVDTCWRAEGSGLSNKTLDYALAPYGPTPPRYGA